MKEYNTSTLAKKNFYIHKKQTPSHNIYKVMRGVYFYGL